MIKDFFSLIYPHYCLSCGKSLYKYEKCICTYCQYHLPKTNYHFQTVNPVIKLFWGKINLNAAASYYQFHKGGKVQHLLHQLKYKGRQEIGISIGQNYGRELLQSPLFKTIDMILPIPLHPSKLKKRGYNQSACFATGLADAMQVTTDTSTLIRNIATESQTRKSRYKRWENVSEVFELTQKEPLTGKHILLVDDVITTGSTLEACSRVLLEVPGTKVSIATIACAN